MDYILEKKHKLAAINGRFVNFNNFIEKFIILNETSILKRR